MTYEYLDDDDDAMRPMIHRAAGRGDAETVSSVLDGDPVAINCRNEIENQPLHEACWAKHAAVVRLLIDRGADVNAPGDFGQRPLHFAVRDGGQEANNIVKMLVEAGADVTATEDRVQEDPLGFALREHKDELERAIELLRQHGAKG